MKRFATRILLGLCIISSSKLCAEIITTLQKNDPVPLWSTYFPLDFLLSGRKAYYKGVANENFPETFSLSISPFYQKASRGRNFENKRVLLSDLEGRWNMLGLLYGGIPIEVQNLLATPPGTLNDAPPVIPSTQQLGNAKIAIFSDLPARTNQNPPPPFIGPAFPNTTININPNSFPQYLLDDECKRVGYFSVPIRYRKTGLRFELQLSPINDFGVTVRTGWAEIKQTYTKLWDRIPVDPGCCTDTECPVPAVPEVIDCCPARVATANIPPEFKVSINKVPGLLPGAEINPCGMNPSLCQERWEAIEETLMEPDAAKRIFGQIGLDPCNFRDTSVEDTFISVWFRHAFKINTWSNEPKDRFGNGQLTNCAGCALTRDQAGFDASGRPSDPLHYHVDTGCGDLCVDTSYCYDYSAFLFIPFISFNASLPTAKKLNRNQLFGLAFGNDGHTGIGMDAGFDFDFYETIEFGFEAGFMRWDCRETRADTDDIFPDPTVQAAHRWFTGFRLPSQYLQSGIFPYGTTVIRKPGTNWHFSIVLSAYRFLCNLSGFAQFVFMSHAEDELHIPNPDRNNPVITADGTPGFTNPNRVRIFKPDLAECRSKFEARVFNTGLNYEIGENFSLGFLVQWPVAQRNAYRSTTYMGSLRMLF